MRLGLTLGTGAALALLLATPAAQAFWFDPARVTGAWCLAHSSQDGLLECSFATFQQCQETRLGVGGSCEPNPAYHAAPPPRRAKPRRH